MADLDTLTAIYEHLDTSKREVRLIQLHSSPNRDEPIRIDLSTASLDDDPEYEAISYCWGDPTDTVDIYIGTHIFPVTVSLHGALRCLREQDETVTLWADAVCINQSDLPERGSQVRMMGEIYSRADGVRVWLGEEDDSTELGLQTMGDLEAGLDCWTQVEGFRENWFPEMDDLGYWNFGVAAAQAVLRVVGRAWFERLWVVQEMVLSSSEPVFHLGQYTFGRSFLLLFSEALYKLCRRSFAPATFPGGDPAFTALGQARRILLDSLALILTIGERSSTHERLTTLTSCGGKKCSDVRDKVYGLLALMDLGPEFYVDYTETAETVFHRAAVAMVQNSGSLRQVPLQVLVLASDLCTPAGTDARPSWVPDFASDPDLRLLDGSSGVLVAHVGFLACGPTFPVAHWNDANPLVLTTRALRVASIDSTLPSACAQPQVNEIVSRYRAIVIAYVAAAQAYLCASPTDIWDILCLGIKALQGGPENRILSKEDKDMLVEYMGPLSPGQSPPEDGTLTTDVPWLLTFLVQMCTTAQQYALCKTNTGLNGSVPNASRSGDVVCVLSGSTIPWILRPRRDKGAVCYQMIGPCYVHGIMEGQAVLEAAKKQDVAEDDRVFDDIHLV